MVGNVTFLLCAVAFLRPYRRRFRLTVQLAKQLYFCPQLYKYDADKKLIPLQVVVEMPSARNATGKRSIAMVEKQD